MPWVLVLPFIPEDGLGASNAWAAWWPVSTVGGRVHGGKIKDCHNLE